MFLEDSVYIISVCIEHAGHTHMLRFFFKISVIIIANIYVVLTTFRLSSRHFTEKLNGCIRHGTSGLHRLVPEKEELIRQCFLIKWIM